jgi:hypothetical protein
MLIKYKNFNIMKKRTLFYLLFAILIIFNLGCEEEEETIDVLPPSEVTDLTATPGEQVVTLDWSNPEDEDFDHVEIFISPGDDLIEIPKGVNSYNIVSLENGIEYTFILKAVDITSNISVGVSISSTPIDLIAPQNVTNFIATKGEKKVTLNWTEPNDVDFVKVEISYTPGSTDLIYVNKGIREYTVEGLTIGTEYSFTIKTIDDDENKSDGTTAIATPALEIEGTYKCIEGEYYYNGDLFGLSDYWLDEFQIELIDANTYKMIGMCAWPDNKLFFQIDGLGDITYPATWDGIDQTLNDQPITTCELHPGDLINVYCGNSNFVTYNEIDGKHKLTMTFGYYTSGSGPREFYQILEKL